MKFNFKKGFFIIFLFLTFLFSYSFFNINSYYSASSQKLNNIENRLILRKLNENLDSDLDERIIYIKGFLPEDLQNKSNFGYAKVYISGFEGEYIAHSSMNDAHPLHIDNETIVMSPLLEQPIFNSFEVEGLKEYFLRDKDTEFKILNNIAQKLDSETDISGKILLYSDLIPCLSCDFVIKKFLEKYSNVSIEVVFR